jgi:hypothetical protein
MDIFLENSLLLQLKNAGIMCSSELFFKPVSDEFVEKQINKINIKKATGIDQISFKILKIAKPCCGSSNYSAYKFIN